MKTKKTVKPRKKQSGTNIPHKDRIASGQIGINIYLTDDRAIEAYNALQPKYDGKTAMVSEALIELNKKNK